MHNEHVFSAPSFSEVIKQLLIYRPTGVLTIRRATAIHQEVSIIIDRGRPRRVRWGRYEENANEAILAWLDSWGEIHFTFQVMRLQLPAPPPTQRREPSRPVPRTTQPPPFPPGLAATQPLPALHPRNRPEFTTSPRSPVTQVLKERKSNSVTPTPSTLHTPDMNNTHHIPNKSDDTPSQYASPLSANPPERAIPGLTAKGRNYPVATLPRYDRTIFLLINGQRTLSDLAHLTKRSPAAVYASLRRLQDLQVILLEA